MFFEHIQRQIQVGSISHTLVNKILFHFVCQACGFFIDQSNRCFQLYGFEQRVHYGFFGLFVYAAFHFAAYVFLHFFAHFGNVAIRNTQGFCKICIDFRQSRFGNVVQRNGKHGSFTGNVFTVVVFREIDGNVFTFASLHADYAGFKFRQHLTCAQYEGVVFGCAAGKRFAVDFAFKVNDDAVAVSGFAFDMVEAGALFAQDFYGLVHFGITDGSGYFFNFLCRQIADNDFGEHFKNGGNFERLFIVLFFNAFKTGEACHFQLLGNGNIVEAALHQLVDHVVLCARTVHLGNHF
ncbi:hypothetical protein NM3173_2190 [Neisseria meningitidis NM3173]|nr:hypothetical protein NM3173_2190 [Neisseria meningitidis NM3173]